MARSGFARLASLKFAYAVFGLIALGSHVASAQSMPTTQEAADKAYYERQRQEIEAERNKTIHVGKYDLTRADREGLGTKLNELLSVRDDDLKRSLVKAADGQRLYETEDLNTRKKYFSDEAWSQYQLYVAQQRALLKIFRGKHMATGGGAAVASVQFKPASNDMISVSAEGGLFYDSQDNWCGTDVPERRFNLDITYLPGKPGLPDSLKIDKWYVQFCGTSDLSCLYKHAVEYSKSEMKAETASSEIAKVSGKDISLNKDEYDAVLSRLQGLLKFSKVYSVLPTETGLLVNKDFNVLKKYFSESAWKEYLIFAYNASSHSSCRITGVGIASPAVKKIDENNFQVSFKADYFGRSVGTICGKGVVKIEGSYLKQGPSYQDFVFTSWHGNLCSKDESNCENYNKLPEAGSEEQDSRSTQSYLLKSLLEWGKRTSLDLPFGGFERINLLEDRRKYFSDDAWTKYKKYIEYINSNMEERQILFSFVPEEQNFEEAGTGKAIFKTHGIWEDADSPGLKPENQFGMFEARIEFQKTGNKASDILVTDWAVDVHDPDKNDQERLRKKMQSE